MTVSRLILAVVLMLALFPAGSVQGQTGYADAYEQSRDEFKAVQGSIATTKSAVDGTKLAVDRIEAQLHLKIQQLRKANQPVPEELKNLAAKFKNARMTLRRSQVVLENFGVYSDKITAVTDVYDEMAELRAKMAADRRLMGDLAGELRALAKFMEKGSDYVPILGKAIELYSRMATGMVEKLGEVAAIIDQNRNQGQIGRGSFSTNERNRIFRDFQRSHPELIADLYTPTVPEYLYEPQDGPSGGNGVLWDEQLRQFSVVPADIPAKEIYRMTLLLQTRLPAADLKKIMAIWKEDGAPHLAAARGLHNLLNSVRNSLFVDVVSRADRASNGFLFRLLQDPDLLEALYVFDPGTRARLHRSLREVHDGLVAEGALEQAEKLRNFARKHNLGIALAGPQPVAPPQPKPVAKKPAKKPPPPVAGRKIQTQNPPPQKAARPVAGKAPPPRQAVPPVAAKKPVPKPAPKPVPKPASKPAPKKPKVKAGQVVGSCSNCIQNGFDCACGRAACRCCARGDNNCNAFDL